MTAPRDKFGRPIVVVTGMGVITSLGAGKTDNWAKLTAGESGIRTVTRFPIDGLKTTMAGTVDFVSVEPFSTVGLTEQIARMVTEEALEQSEPVQKLVQHEAQPELAGHFRDVEAGRDQT